MARAATAHLRHVPQQRHVVNREAAATTHPDIWLTDEVQTRFVCLVCLVCLAPHGGRAYGALCTARTASPRRVVAIARDVATILAYRRGPAEGQVGGHVQKQAFCSQMLRRSSARSSLLPTAARPWLARSFSLQRLKAPPDALQLAGQLAGPPGLRCPVPKRWPARAPAGCQPIVARLAGAGSRQFGPPHNRRMAALCTSRPACRFCRAVLRPGPPRQRS